MKILAFNKRYLSIVFILLALIMHLSYFKWRVRVCPPLINSVQLKIPSGVNWDVDSQYLRFEIRDYIYGVLFVRDGQNMWKFDSEVRNTTVWRIFPEGGKSLWSIEDDGQCAKLTASYLWGGIYIPLLLLLVVAWMETKFLYKGFVKCRHSLARIWAWILSAKDETMKFLGSSHYSKRRVLLVVFAFIAVTVHLTLFKWRIRVDLPFVSQDAETLHIVTDDVFGDKAFLHWHNWLGFIDGCVYNRSSLNLELDDYIWGGIIAPLVLLTIIACFEEKAICSGVVAVARVLLRWLRTAGASSISNHVDAIKRMQKPESEALVSQWMLSPVIFTIIDFGCIVLVPVWFWVYYIKWFFPLGLLTPGWYVILSLPAVALVFVGGYLARQLFSQRRRFTVAWAKKTILIVSILSVFMTYQAFQWAFVEFPDPFHMDGATFHSCSQVQVTDAIYMFFRERYDPRLAVERGDLHKLEQLLNSTWEIEKPCTHNEGTILHHAAEYGDSVTVRFLVERGSNVNARDRIGETPLWRAALRGDAYLVNYLLEHGAVTTSDSTTHRTILLAVIMRPRSFQVDNGRGYVQSVPLTEGNTEVVRLLVRHGADVNETTRFFRDTPLKRAQELNMPTMVACLLELGADTMQSMIVDATQ